MPNHKSTAAMNYSFSKMTNTIIFMPLGDLRIRHTTAVLFSPLHIWWRNQRNLSTYIESNSYCVSNNIFKYLFVAKCVAYMSNWSFTSSKFHVGGDRNIRQDNNSDKFTKVSQNRFLEIANLYYGTAKPQMSAFSSHICVYMFTTK